MENELIKRTFKEMKRGLSRPGKCPDEAELACFLEGIMDEKEAERIEEHLVLCPKCCDYLVSLNRVIHFPSEERLPEVPDEQMRKVSALVKDKKKYSFSENISGNLERITQSIREFFTPLEKKPRHLWWGEKSNKFGQFLKLRPNFLTGFTFTWIRQPIPVAVRSGALALLVLLIVSTTFLYYQQGEKMGVQMEIMGKTSVIPTRGVPAGEPVEKIIKEGDSLYSNDYCRINFEVDRDAYTYVLYYDSRGILHQLYPDSAIGIPQKVKGNTRYTIPTGEDDWFQLDSHSGTETVFVLASREPIRDFNETIDTFQGKSAEEALEVFKSKANEVKVLSFKHQ